MTPRPPRLAEWLVRRSAPDYDQAAMLGDLAEEFAARAERDGPRAARAWYRRQVRHSVIPNLRRRLATEIPSPPEKRTMTGLLQDIRLAARSLVRQPLLSLVAVLSLTIGIGLTTGVFGLLDAAVLRALPVRDPSSLRVVLEIRTNGENHNFTYPGFASYRAQQQSFTDVAAHSEVESAVNTSAGSEMIPGELVSGSYFSMLAPAMTIGRPLVDADDAPASPPVVVLGEAEWRRRFGDARDLGNRTIRLNGVDFAVIGVVASPFRGMTVGRDARFFAAIAQQPVLMPSGARSLVTSTTASWLTVIGRLRSSVADDQAAAELNAIGARLTNAGPGVVPRFRLADGSQGDSGLPAQVAPTLELLLGASALVLLVACANVAGLLLARTNDRQRELAVRAALGGGRWRLARMLMAESLVLGLTGAGLGIVLAQIVARTGSSLFVQFGQPVTLDVGPNPRGLALAVAAGFIAALMSAIAPVLRGWRSLRVAGLGEGGRSATSGRSARRWRRGLVVAQFAVTFAMVATAGLLVRTLVNLRAIPTGLDTEHVLLVGMNLGAVQLSPDRTRDFVARVVVAAEQVPGVRAAGYGQVVPLGIGGSRQTISAPGFTPGPDDDTEINYNVVSPGYFNALGVDLVEGRTFRDGLAPDDRPVEVVVNETLARRFWPGQPALGRTMHLGESAADPLMEVVGVARNVKYRMLREDPGPSFYYSVAQATRVRAAVLHVRAAGDPLALGDSIRRAIATVDSRVPVTYVRPLSDQQLLNINRERVTMLVGLALGAAALVLSAVGMFGAIAGLVASRLREMGVRLALGAEPGALVMLVLRDGVTMAIVGGAIGLALAYPLGRTVQASLFGVTAFDPPSLAAAFGLLAFAATLAAWLPAMRVTKVDPVEVLRAD